MHHFGDANELDSDLRMSSEEAKAVVQLWQRQQTERESVQSMPSIRDLAEALRIPEAEVGMLLHHVRSEAMLGRHRPASTRALPKATTQIAAIAAALVVFFVLLAFLLVGTSRVAEPVIAGTPAPMVQDARTTGVDATAPIVTSD